MRRRSAKPFSFGRDAGAAPLRRAGVGAGTVYRHFPTKTDLLEAVMQQRIDQMAARATACLDAPDVGEAFFTFCREVVISSPRSKAVRTTTAARRSVTRIIMSCNKDAMRSRHQACPNRGS